MNRSVTNTFLLEVAVVLAIFIHPSHIVCLRTREFIHLPPTCNTNEFRCVCSKTNLSIVVQDAKVSGGLKSSLDKAE
ncbi:hypothetical protein C6H59_01985 [Vibrio cholerae]|nr:hypothetical protein CGT87_17045 [Vibrio cholerae]